MKIGGRSFHDSQVDAMSRLSDALAAGQGRISFGKRFAAASEAPVEAQRAAVVARRQADTAQFALGLDQAEQRLTVVDGAVGGVVDGLYRIRELALLASSETSAPGDRRIFANEAREILNVMVSYGNAQDASGNYVFAGARATTPAFGRDALTGAVVYQGLGEMEDIVVGANARVRATEPGPALFGDVSGTSVATDAFAIVERFIAVLDAPPADRADSAAVALERLEFDASVEGAARVIDHLGVARASFGGRLGRIEAERDRLTQVADNLTVARSRLEDTDLAATIADLSRASLVLTATQRSFAQVSRLSLFDELR